MHTHIHTYIHTLMTIYIFIVYLYNVFSFRYVCSDILQCWKFATQFTRHMHHMGYTGNVSDESNICSPTVTDNSWPWAQHPNILKKMNGVKMTPALIGMCFRLCESSRLNVQGKRRFTWSASRLRVSVTSSPTRLFQKQEMLGPTDLNRAGVLRIVQQPHGAVAFPVQTPDAAAHQSAQHLLDRLRTGPGRRALSANIQVDLRPR